MLKTLTVSVFPVKPPHLGKVGFIFAYSHIRGLPRSITRELNVVARHNTYHR